MKWRNIIAQGFSPGSGPNEIAMKWRPMPIAPQLSLWPRLVPGGWRWRRSSYLHPNTRLRRTFGRPFRARLWSAEPRAKALGYSVSPFHGVLHITRTTPGLPQSFICGPAPPGPPTGTQPAVKSRSLRETPSRANAGGNYAQLGNHLHTGRRSGRFSVGGSPRQRRRDLSSPFGPAGMMCPRARSP